MNKYKIGKYIVTANSVHDAVSVVRRIKNTSDDSIKDGKYVSELKPGDVITKKDGSKWDVVLVRHTPFGIQVRMNSKTSPVKTEEITYRPTDMLAYDSVKDSTGSDIVSEVKKAYPGVGVSQIVENRSIKGENYRKTELTFDFKKIPDKFESANRMFSYIERKYSDGAQVFKKSDKTYVVIIFENLKKDSFQKDANYQLRYNNGAAADMSYFKLVKETPTQLVFKNLLYIHKDEQFIYVDKKTKAAVYSSGEKIGTMADAVEKTGDSVKDADEYMIEGNIVDKNDPMMTYQAYQNIARKYHLTIKNYTGDMLDLYGSKDNLKRYERDMHMSYSSIEKAHDSVKDAKHTMKLVNAAACKDARRINYDDDIIEVTLNGKVVFKGYAEEWIDNNFDSNFKWTGSQYEASNAKGKWVVKVVDSFQKDSLTVRDVIQSLINEETSAISSYNVALETLKDHIPAEAYEAIKAIRDDEQRHVENLYAVLNGNVTPKNLEN